MAPPNPLELPIWPGAATDTRCLVRMRKRGLRLHTRLRLLRANLWSALCQWGE